jgi:hypothetical protein
MRYVSRALLAGGLGLATAFLAACGGGSGLLSTSQANMLTAEVNQASTYVSNGDCVSADNVLGRLQTQVANLPASINPTLVSDLDQGAATVRSLADKRCSGATGTGTDTTRSPAVTPTTTNQNTTTTSTSTTQTQTETTTTQPPTTPSTATTPPGSGTTSTGGNGGATLPGNGSGGDDGGTGTGGGTGGGTGFGPGG